tara:strand:+ start:134 stop:322 length:189 start_codon:yes stop_codon:yes gene_type:complete
MTRKHYIKFAELLKTELKSTSDTSYCFDVLESLANGMADIFEDDNPNFVRSLFMNAVYAERN